MRLEDGRRRDTGTIDPIDFSAASIASRRRAGAEDMRRAMELMEREDAVAVDQIGGVIHQFRRGSLLSKTEAVDVVATREDWNE